MKLVSASSLFLFSAILTVFALTPSGAQDANPTTLSAAQCKLAGNKRIVPNILGFAPNKAREIVESCGFLYDPETVKTISYEAIGAVGDQQPSGGTVAKMGDTIKGFESAGVFLPEFRDWKSSDAQTFIKSLRHGVTTSEISSDQPEGTVVSQTPKNAEFYNSGLAPNLIVSKGPYVIVPNIAGWNYSNAVAKLESIGLAAKHKGGYFKEFLKPTLPPCEAELHYPRVISFEPKNEVKKGTEIQIETEEGITDVLLPPPKGKQCP
jgi:PASTA domain